MQGITKYQKSEGNCVEDNIQNNNRWRYIEANSSQNKLMEMQTAQDRV